MKFFVYIYLGIKIQIHIPQKFHTPPLQKFYTLWNKRQLKSDCRDIIDDYEKENKNLKRLVDTFKKNIKIFIKWICKKFDIAEYYALVRDFEKETRISLDAERQIKKEDREKEWDLER